MAADHGTSPSQASAVPEQQRILLHVVSPSAEVPDRLVFPDFSTATTVIGLKRAIQDRVPTKPAPERQRLIYRGRALIQDNVTLKEVVGLEAVRL